MKMPERAKPRWLSVINFVLIKVAWVACVVGGTLPGAIVISVMLVLCFYQGRWQRERKFVFGLTALGLVLDSAWIYLGILDFGPNTVQIAGLALPPFWILFLWVAVGLSLFEALGFLVRKPLIGAVIVGGTAPLSYSTGAQLGAVVVPSTPMLMVIALVWMVVFAVVFETARRAQQTNE